MQERNGILAREQSELDKRKRDQCTSGGLSFRTELAQLTWKGGKAENTGADMMWW